LVISTNQFKNGNHIEVEGTVFKILEFQHVKPGKGGAFVRTKLRRANDGAVIDRTFRAGEKFRSIHTEARKMQFLYSDGTDAHFMDAESYEQLAIPQDNVAEALRWTKASDTVDVLFIDGSPGDLQLPSSVELEVTETEHRSRRPAERARDERAHGRRAERHQREHPADDRHVVGVDVELPGGHRGERTGDQREHEQHRDPDERQLRAAPHARHEQLEQPA